MQRRSKKQIIFAVALVMIITSATILFVHSGKQHSEDTQAFVGVTYGGDSVSEAKQLIDKVKSYTNLFVLQSGNLQRDINSINEIGDYAVEAGLHFLPYFGHYIEDTFSVWFDSAKERWGDHLIGVYYSDELGGKMLDDYTKFTDSVTGDSIMKTRYSDVVVEKTNGVTIHYELNGKINLYEPTSNEDGIYSTYYPNGTVISNQPTATASTTYQQLLNAHPFKNSHEVAQQFLTLNHKKISFLKNLTTVFSSDYALYWYDYQVGYDVLFTQLGWNISLNQQISLCRGAATAQNKDWGAIITWKYNTPPYLDSGEEIYNQLKTSYECGAKYLILFNFYEEGVSNSYGTLKEEHFDALKRFWHDVVQNPSVDHGRISVDSVLVLPKNFGGGLRWRDDIVWGIFKADETSGKIWDLTQSALNTHGYALNIVYDDPDYPLSSGYKNIIKFQDE